MLELCCNLHNNGKKSSAIQIRFNWGVKGVLVLSEDLPDDTIVFTESMIKFALDETCKTLEIIKFSKFSQGYLNKYTIILLNFLRKRNLGHQPLLKKILTLSKKQLNKSTNFCQSMKLKFDLVSNEEEDNLIHDQFKKSLTMHYKKNSILNIKNNFRVLLPKSTNLLGVIDFHNILEEGEVFIQIDKNYKTKILKGDVLVTRSPCISKYDLQKFTCINNEKLHNLNNVIVFSSRGKIPATIKMCNSDLDGDTFYVIYDRKILNIIKTEPFKEETVSNLNYVEYDPKIIDKIDNLQINIFKYFCYINKNDKIGLLSSKFVSESLASREFNNSLQNLAEAISLEVDFPKKGLTCNLMINNNINIPEYLKIKQSDYIGFSKFILDIESKFLNFLENEKKNYIINEHLIFSFLSNYQSNLEKKLSIMKVKYSPKPIIKKGNFFEQLSNLYDISSYQNLCFLNEFKKSLYIYQFQNNDHFNSKFFIILQKFFENEGKSYKFRFDSLCQKISYINNKFNNELKLIMKKYNIYFEEDFFMIYLKSDYSKFFKDREEFIKIINFSFQNLIKEVKDFYKNELAPFPRKMLLPIIFLLNNFDLKIINSNRTYNEIIEVIAKYSISRNYVFSNSDDFLGFIRNFERNYFDCLRLTSFYFII